MKRYIATVEFFVYAENDQQAAQISLRNFSDEDDCHSLVKLVHRERGDMKGRLVLNLSK